MLEFVIVQIGKFVKYKKEKKRNALFKKVVHQTFWLIGCSQ